jgi:hypothetical protein
MQCSVQFDYIVSFSQCRTMVDRAPHKTGESSRSFTGAHAAVVSLSRHAARWNLQIVG